MPPAALPPPVAEKDATAGEVVLAYLWEQADAIRRIPRCTRTLPTLYTTCARRVGECAGPCKSFRSLLDRTRTDGLVPELRWLAGGSAVPATSRSRRSGSGRPWPRYRPSSPSARSARRPPG